MSFDGPIREAVARTLTRAGILANEKAVLERQLADDEKLLAQVQASIVRIKALMVRNAVERGASAETLRQCMAALEPN
jgi:predicted regulator of amino acid metabolism with ACT domain